MEELNKEQQIMLLNLARKVIYEYLTKKSLPEVNWSEFSDAVFKEKCGAFVTLHIEGMLRGCIGYLRGIETIPQTIINMAKSSAFEDPRFPSLGEEEYEKIDIEISILSPIEGVRGISEIVVGKDGLIITNGNRSGLLLPQVAAENNWDVFRFLEHTCYKAGLPGDAWKRKETQMEKFTAQVFGEMELDLLNK